MIFRPSWRITRRRNASTSRQFHLRSFQPKFSRSGYYCKSQTHMDDDGCIRRRMFVLLQPLAYQVIGVNSLKQMETRRHVCLPKGMRNTESSSSNNFVFLQRLSALEGRYCFLIFSAGKGEARVGTEARPKMSSKVRSSIQTASYKGIHVGVCCYGRNYVPLQIREKM